MNNRKLRIAEFVENLGSDQLSSSIVLGGATKPTDGTRATTNGKCTNTTKDSCNKSTNNIDCKNSNVCNDSKNPGTCDNSYVPAPSSNPTQCM